MNSDRVILLRQERTGSARNDQPALDVSPANALLEQIVEPANLERAWRRVRRNRGAPGPDGMTLKAFEPWVRANWPTVRQQLLDGTYRPAPVRRKTIQKEGGGERLLGIPNVLDRLIQQAIHQVLTPLFDPGFSESSHGFRPTRSAHGAAKQVQRTIRQGYQHVVDVDLSKFFDRVQHDVLMSRVSRKVHDARVLRLIGRYLRAGVMVEGVKQPTDQGSPQGGPLAPPTKVQNFLVAGCASLLRKKGEVDPVDDSYLCGLDHYAGNQRAEYFAFGGPVSVVQIC